MVKVKNSLKPVYSYCVYIRRRALLFATHRQMQCKCPSLLSYLLSCAAHYVTKRLIVSQGSCDFIRKRRIHPNVNQRTGHEGLKLDYVGSRLACINSHARVLSTQGTMCYTCKNSKNMKRDEFATGSNGNAKEVETRNESWG